MNYNNFVGAGQLIYADNSLHQDYNPVFYISDYKEAALISSRLRIVNSIVNKESTKKRDINVIAYRNLVTSIGNDIIIEHYNGVISVFRKENNIKDFADFVSFNIIDTWDFIEAIYDAII